jgi:hypothetical protein
MFVYKRRSQMFRFKLTLFLSAVLAIISMEAVGMFARYSETELIKSSDLIVVGTLIGRTTLQLGADTGQLNVGVIAIQDQLKGAQDESIALLLLPSENKALVSDTIAYKVGQQGLWFLRSRDPVARGLYVADHPQRFEPMEGILERVAEMKSLVAESE